ncbi:MAG: signal peptidase II [Clostridia bacterium]|nr:signal peptidase II [Clostridia bacterium]
MNMREKLTLYAQKFSVALKKPFQGMTLSRIALLLTVELLFFAVILTLDLVTKRFIYQTLRDTGSDFIIIKGVLVLTPIENTGASFGMFQNSTTILSIISLVTVIIVAVFQVFSVKNRNFFLRSGVVMIIGGGVGNMIDRFMLGYVRDFIYFELIDFAVFNIADSALTVGVIFILIFILFFYKPDDKKNTIKKKDDTKEVPSK